MLESWENEEVWTGLYMHRQLLQMKLPGLWCWYIATERTHVVLKGLQPETVVKGQIQNMAQRTQWTQQIPDCVIMRIVSIFVGQSHLFSCFRINCDTICSLSKHRCSGKITYIARMTQKLNHGSPQVMWLVTSHHELESANSIFITHWAIIGVRAIFSLSSYH
jgi:hypothetical protein